MTRRSEGTDQLPTSGAGSGDTVPLGQLTADPANPRRRTARGRQLLVQSLKDLGAARSIVVDETGTILAGNGVAEAAADAGITQVRIIDATGDELIAIRRSGLSDLAKRQLTIAENRTAELAEWDPSVLVSVRDAGLDLRPFWTAEEEAELASKASAEAVMRIAQAPAEGEPPPTDQQTEDVQTFSCGLTVEQERIVRAALRAARAFYGVETTANALVATLKTWTDDHAAESRPPRRTRETA